MRSGGGVRIAAGYEVIGVHMGVHRDEDKKWTGAPGPVALRTAAVRAVDRLAADRYGLQTLVLMESAGAAVADAVHAWWRERSDSGIRRPFALVLAGTGQNGGDGHVAARHLAAAGWEVAVWLAGDPAKLRGDARVNWDVLDHSGVPRQWMSGPGQAPLPQLDDWLSRADAVIDALLGTGFRGEPRGAVAETMRHLRRWQQTRSGRTSFVVAADIPSGVDAESGAAAAHAVRADATVTFVARKPGLLQEPGRSLAGTVHVSTLGVPPACVADAEARETWRLSLVDPAVLRHWLPVRPRTAHKHTAGHVAVLAGAPGYSGAAVLAGRAALRGGAGLVTIGTAAATVAHVAGALPEAMVRPLGEAVGAVAGAAAVAAGPGLVGFADEALQFLAAAPPTQPWVLDAAVLRALAGRLDKLRAMGPERLVLTPHPGELAGLLGCTSEDVQADRLGAVQRAALESGAVVVLKGAPTLVARPGHVCVNSTGNPVLATAGSGDVLTGLIAALQAQGLGSWQAAVLGVCWHGLAGDWLARTHGPAGALAGDVAEALLPARMLLTQEGTR